MKAGDQLFLTALARLAAQRNVEANSVLILGNYLFSGNPLPSNEPPSRIMVSPVQVGPVPLAADVLVNRESFTPRLVSPFLTTAAEILSRPVEAADEQRRYSAAAFLLIPKAKEFAPDTLATFAAVAQRSDAGLAADAAARDMAAALSKADTAYSLQLFREGLAALDNAKYRGRQLLEYGWVETVAAGSGSVRFDLQPAVAPFTYQETLKSLLVADRPSVLAAVSGLATESLSGAHMIAVSRILLELTGKETAASAP